MQPANNGKLRLRVLAGLMLLQPPSLAMEADSQQPVLWSSDGDSTMRIEANTRFLEMTENVKVTQGTLQILGSEAVFEYDVETNRLLRVSVHGSPVRYQQQLDDEGTLVTGSSDTVLLYRDQNDEYVLEFVGNAKIDSPDSSMACAAIIYLANQDLIREATGPCEGTLSSRGN